MARMLFFLLFFSLPTGLILVLQKIYRNPFLCICSQGIQIHRQIWNTTDIKPKNSIFHFDPLVSTPKSDISVSNAEVNYLKPACIHSRQKNQVSTTLIFFQKMATHDLNMPPTEILHESFFVRLVILHLFVSLGLLLRCIITKVGQKKNKFRSLLIFVGYYKILVWRKNGHFQRENSFSRL